jgi:hypothetical protein
MNGSAFPPLTQPAWLRIVQERGWRKDGRKSVHPSGPVVHALHMYTKYDSVRLLPNAEVPADV